MKLDFIRPVIKYLPEVKLPERKIPFKEKLMWTGVILLLFFMMGVIYPYGVSRESLSEHIRGFEQMTMIFASSIGSLTSVGIGPIVTSSIILQLLQGADMIQVDLKTKEGKALFQATQKVLTIILAFFEAGALVVATNMVEGTGLIAFTILQIAMGSIILMYMDEVTSKWGIGSGISLFIAAGVSQTILLGSLNPLKSAAGQYAGYIPNFISQMMSGNPNYMLLWPLTATAIVFLMATLGESMKLEIPLSYGGIRGIGGRFPIKFFYVSNIPVILAAALLMNVTMWAGFAGVDTTGAVSLSEMTAFQRIIYTITDYLTLGNLYGVLAPGNLGMLTDTSVIIHMIIYLIVFCGLCVLFGSFWVQTTGMDSESVAKQIQEGGMQIPGFRRDKRVVKRVLDKYIPQITIISSIAVGLVAAIADMMGALGSGTGILLTIGILYRFYEEIQKEQMADMPAAFRHFMGVD
ncbi:MAG: preprotein translocase subunit SecY [Candidatus Altiarchaeota archaeon]